MSTELELLEEIKDACFELVPVFCENGCIEPPINELVWAKLNDRIKKLNKGAKPYYQEENQESDNEEPCIARWGGGIKHDDL